MSSKSNEFRHFENGCVKLRIRRNTKFKTTFIKLFVVTNLSEDATRMALLPSILRRGCSDYPTMRDMARRLEEMYGATFSAGVVKVGEWHILQFRIEVIADKYRLFPGNLLEEAVGFLRSVVADPLVVRGGFKAAYVSREKKRLKKIIRRLINDKASYALEKALSAMCAGEPYRIYEYGNEKDVPSVTPKNLFSFYRKKLVKSPLWIYSSGDVDVDSAAARILDALSFGGAKKTPLKEPVIKKPPARVRRVHERFPDAAQGQFVMGFRTGTRFRDVEYVPLAFASGLLGGFPSSKLFQVLREKHGLAYSVFSSLVRTKGIMYVYAGVDEDSFDRVEEIVLENLDMIKAGKFTSAELSAARKAILSALRAVADSPEREADNDFMHVLTGRKDTISGLMERVRKIKRDEIAEAARLVGPDVVYTLGRKNR